MKKIIFAAALSLAVIFTSCGDKGGIRMGSLNEFDSLSYALGANIGYGMKMEMSDIPFDYALIATGITESAFDKATQDHEVSLNLLRDYFMTKRGERAQLIAARIAADSTIVPVTPDSTMFANAVERDSISYAFGNDLGFNIKESGMPIHIVWVNEAMKQAREGNAKMTEEEVGSYLQYYFMVKRPAENAEASAKYLEKIAKKSGVKKTESGILYKITREGDAEVIAKDPRDVVVVNYKGTTRLGKQFDSSYDRKEPAEFALDRVIKGWTEGMQLVGKGGAITLWIPAELAYGQRGGGRDIGPNEALCFEVEVLDVKPYVEPAPVIDTAASIPATKLIPAETK